MQARVLLVVDRLGAPIAWVVIAGILLAVARWRFGRVSGLTLLAVAVVAAAVVVDLTQVATESLRDWHLYLRAAERWMRGERVYLDTYLIAVPADPKDYPFLYPPMTLPIFAAFALLPAPLADALYVVALIVGTCVALWLLGLRPTWWLAFFAWTPVFQGIYVGNVVVPTLLLVAAGTRVGGGLVVAGLFKLYAGLSSLWLARERRFRELVAGVGVLVAWGLVTLPLTGVGLWRSWADGLAWVERSQPLHPELLYYLGLERSFPQPLAVGLAVAAVAVAFVARGKESLARFGVATVVASPSVYLHGTTVALPAILSLRPALTWLVVGFTSFVPPTPFWPALGIVAASWFVPALRRTREDAVAAAEMDPLGRLEGPWPDAMPGLEPERVAIPR
jgi:hypothetical protein